MSSIAMTRHGSPETEAAQSAVHDAPVAFAPTPLIARNETERLLLIGLHMAPDSFRHPQDLYGDKPLTRHVHDTLSRWVRHGVVQVKAMHSDLVYYRISPEFTDPVRVRQRLIHVGDDLRRSMRRTEERAARAGAHLQEALAGIEGNADISDRAARGALHRALRAAQSALVAYEPIDREDDAIAARVNDLAASARSWGFDPDAVWAGAMSDDAHDNPLRGDA